MWRKAVLATLIGLIGLPTGAWAFYFPPLVLRPWRLYWARPVYYPTPMVYLPPVYYSPPWLACPPVLPHCQPPTYWVVPASPPVIEPATKPMNNPPPATTEPKPSTPPMVETIPPKPSAPAKSGLDVKPAELKDTTPKVPEIRPEIPAPVAPTPKEKEKLPEPALPSFPAIPGPEISPSAPKKDDPLKLPPLIQPVPGSSGLPPLNVPNPTDVPKRSSQASPLTRSTPVEIYWVEGTAPASPNDKRKVNFFNHTESTIELSLEGKTVRLPKKHFLAVEVPREFKWRFDDQPEQTTTLPLATPGAEIVIRRAAL